MKIAIFASAFHPHLGGVEELVRQLAHAYKKSGVEVDVLTHLWPENLPSHEVFEGIDVYRLPFLLPDPTNGWRANVKSRLRFLAQKNATTRQLENLLVEREIDLLHIQCIGSCACYAQQAARSLKLPLVVTSQGERTMDASQLFQRSPFHSRMLKEVLDAADYVTACSHDTLRDLEQYLSKPFGGRARVIHNGIALEEFEDVAPHPWQRPYILGIGRLVKQKGFDVLLRAFAEAKLDSHDLLLAGDGEELSSLEGLISELGLAGRAHLTGRAGRAKAMALFKGCDFFVLPSRLEPQGIVNLEAMAAGRPVIATRVGGVPEIVLEGETGLLVPPEDSGALAEAMRRLAGDPGLRERLGSAGANRATEFTWPHLAQEYLGIYRDLL